MVVLLFALRRPDIAGKNSDPRYAGGGAEQQRASSSAPPGGEGMQENRGPAAQIHDAAAMLSAAFRRLETAGERKDKALGGTALALEKMPMQEAEEALIAELESGRDAETGMDFAVGENGVEGAPTWRVYLLDLLGRISPRAAADYARQAIFSSSNSSEEWAVSLRNIMFSYPPRFAAQGRAEMSVLLARMLERRDWRAAPGAGLLEALDFVAHTADPAEQAGRLAQWLDEGGSDPKPDQAIQIAMERALLARGDEILPALSAQTGQGRAGSATLRVMAMARADLRQPGQAQALQQYLQRLPPQSPEAEAFFGAFPLHNYSIAPGLSGLPRGPAAQDFRAADEAALAAMEAWTTDPALQGHGQHLSDLILKLTEWTKNQ